MNYLILTLVGIIGAIYYDTFKWLIESWMVNTYYSHGIIIPIVSGYFIWKMRKDLSNIERNESQHGLIILVAGIILQGIAVLYVTRFLSALSLVITIFGMLIYIYGWKFVNKIKFPILLLLLAIPLPFVDIIAPYAQSISAIASSGLANMVGIPTERNGLLLNTPTGLFEVALECSGLTSVMSLLAISVIYAFIIEGGLLMKFIIVSSSIPLAMIGNILRIVLTLIVANIYGKDTAMSYFHDVSDIMLFSIALIGLLIIGRLFGKIKFKEI